MAAAQVPDPETIRNVAWQIVNQPEYNEPWPWLEKLVAFGNMIKDWLNNLEAWAAANPQLARVLAIVVVIVLLLLLIHLLYLAFGDLIPWKRRRNNPTARTSRWEILQGAATDWRAAAALAIRLLQEGNLRRAVWIAHWVMLGLLDERGAIKFAGWKTNSHYLRECTASHPWYATFAELTSVYERAVYAQQPTVTTSIEHLVQRVDAMTKEQIESVSMTFDKRNWMLAGAAIVLLFALAAVLASLSGERRSDEMLRRPSTYFTDPSGARALLLVMRKLLPAAEQWRKPLTQLPLPDQPHAAYTLIVASPLLPLSKTEAAHLDRWLALGGQLILATSDGWPVRQRVGNESGEERTSEQENKPTVKKSTYLLTHAPALQWSKSRNQHRRSERPVDTEQIAEPKVAAIFSATGEAKVLAAASDNAALAVELPVGQGRIVAIADPTVMNNRALRAADNAVWLVTLAAAWGNGVTYFDEYHHGFGIQKSAVSLAWAFAQTPWGWCVGQIAAAGLLYIFVYRRRFGRISEPPTLTQSNPFELVDARAGIFHAAGAQRLAAQSIMQNLSQDLSQARGRTIDVASLSAQAGNSLAQLQALAAKTERGEKLSEREFIELGRLAGTMSKGRKP